MTYMPINKNGVRLAVNRAVWGGGAGAGRGLAREYAEDVVREAKALAATRLAGDAYEDPKRTWRERRLDVRSHRESSRWHLPAGYPRYVDSFNIVRGRDAAGRFSVIIENNSPDAARIEGVGNNNQVYKKRTGYYKIPITDQEYERQRARGKASQAASKRRGYRRANADRIRESLDKKWDWIQSNQRLAGTKEYDRRFNVYRKKSYDLMEAKRGKPGTKKGPSSFVKKESAGAYLYTRRYRVPRRGYDILEDALDKVIARRRR